MSYFFNTNKRYIFKKNSNLHHIDQLNESLAQDESQPLVILKGIEVDILEKGGLDLPEDVLAHADWVVASLHYVAPVEKYDWYQQSRFVPEIVAVIEQLGPVLWEQGELLFQNLEEHRVIEQSS